MSKELKEITKELHEALLEKAPQMKIDILDLYEIVEKVYDETLKTKQNKHPRDNDLYRQIQKQAEMYNGYCFNKQGEVK